MTRQAPFLIAWLALAAGMLGLAAAAHADTVTRTLQQSINVPAGDSIVVENLVGHMTVTQGNGPLQVTATVIAGGDQAQALAQSIKLDVSRSAKQVRVHVHYPVDEHGTYLYNPPHITGNDNSYCFPGGIFCVQGDTNSGVNYQGRNVQVDQNSNTGTPLYVNLAVKLPAGIYASLSNARGLLEASNLTDTLSLNTQRGGVSVQNLIGNLTATTNAGNVVGANLQGEINLETDAGDADLKSIYGTLHAETDGGDLSLSGNLSALSALQASTSGGDLHVSGDVPALRSLDVSTDGGDVVLQISDLSMLLEASADGGDVSVRLPDVGANTVSEDDYFSGDIGKAAGRGTIHSNGGDITVTQP